MFARLCVEPGASNPPPRPLARLYRPSTRVHTCCVPFCWLCWQDGSLECQYFFKILAGKLMWCHVMSCGVMGSHGQSCSRDEDDDDAHAYGEATRHRWWWQRGVVATWLGASMACDWGGPLAPSSCPSCSLPACAHMRVADGRRAAAEQRAGTGPWAMGAGWRGACCLLAGCPTNPLEDGGPFVNKQFHCECASAVVVVVMVNFPMWPINRYTEGV